MTTTTHSEALTIVPGHVAKRILYRDRAELFGLVKRAYAAHQRGAASQPNSTFLRFPDQPRNRIIALPAWLAGDFDTVGIKWIASYPQNIAQGIPRASATLLLNDAQTGRPYACLESSWISAYRTAASAALAARALQGSRRSAARLAIVGTGLIAQHVWEMLCADGWCVEHISLFDLNPTRSAAFAEWLSTEGAPDAVSVSPTLEEALQHSDVVLFTTVASEPYVHDPKAFLPNALILNVSLRDLGPKIILAADNYADDVEHVLQAGTSVVLAAHEIGHHDFLKGSLTDVLDGRVKVDPERLRIFSPFGLGALDLALGQHVYREAVASQEAVTIEKFLS